MGKRGRKGAPTPSRLGDRAPRGLAWVGSHDPGVDVAGLGQREQVRGVLGVEDVRRGLVDQHRRALVVGSGVWPPWRAIVSGRNSVMVPPFRPPQDGSTASSKITASKCIASAVAAQPAPLSQQIRHRSGTKQTSLNRLGGARTSPIRRGCPASLCRSPFAVSGRKPPSQRRLRHVLTGVRLRHERRAKSQGSSGR